MPYVLLAMMVLAGLVQPWIPISVQSLLYALSLSLKGVIIFILPFLIFGLLFKTAVHLAKRATKTVLFLLAAVCISNFLSTLLSYSVGRFVYSFDLSMPMPVDAAILIPTWEWDFPKLLSNGYALASGLILGIFLGRWKPLLADQISLKVEKGIGILMKGFLYVIPLFILGFVIKMQHDQVLILILQNYACIFAVVAGAIFSYIGLIYLNGREYVRSLKNMLPAAIAGFGSMSSAAAMPLTILGAEKNARNRDLARSIIPATVNIHLIGDCFAIPIFAFAVLSNFGVAEPSFGNYLIFAFYFVLAKFSVAAVPGGGIIVMLPFLESILGLQAEMLSLITALYILFDPIITFANVLGNGGFALVIDRLMRTRES